MWFGGPEFVVAEQASSFSMEIYRARREEGTAGTSLTGGKRPSRVRNASGASFVSVAPGDIVHSSWLRLDLSHPCIKLAPLGAGGQP